MSIRCVSSLPLMIVVPLVQRKVSNPHQLFNFSTCHSFSDHELADVGGSVSLNEDDDHLGRAQES
jgi:hypothetical protein